MTPKGSRDREPVQLAAPEAGTATPHPGQSPKTRPPLHLLRLLPLTFVLALYMLGTGRWGSYIGVVGTPVYVGDLLLVVAAVQVAVTARAVVRTLPRAPVVLQLSLALVAYALVRLLLGGDMSLTALRDFAPYGYASIAVLAFLLPAYPVSHARRAIYGVLLVHLLWLGLLPRAPGFPWSLPKLGNDVLLLGARPDFDAAVAGIAAALALFDLLHGIARGSRLRQVLLAGFLALNVFVMTTLATRAGLLAGMCVLLAALATWLLGRRFTVPVQGARQRTLFQVVLIVIGVIGLLAALAFTPTGARLVEGFSSGSSQAAGTVTVRGVVWGQVARHTLGDEERTAMGVGFGRNFILESGARSALEGTTYTNVRSPHNYVLGTLARLGVAGALLVVLIMGLTMALAWSALRRTSSPSTVLAALVAIALPVTAMFGVVLEAPFGALPYFWAVGELARHWVQRDIGPAT